MDEAGHVREALRRQCEDFLDQDHGHGQYNEKIKALITKENISRNRLRLDVNLQDLHDFSDELYRRLLLDPEEVLGPMEDALEELVKRDFPKTLQPHQTVQVGIVGEFGAHTLSPRQLRAEFLNRLVKVEGIVTRASLVRPKLVRSVQYCSATGQFFSREYRDVTSLNGLPTGSAYPQTDDQGNVLTTEYGLSTFQDQQVLTIQELPETAPPGQMPRGIDIILQNDLCDGAKPGDRVTVVGVYKPMPPRASGSVSGVMKAVIVANQIKPLVRDAGAAKITVQDIRNIEKLAAEPDVLDQLANSLAPSIFGHATIKKGLVLLLLGGRERNLKNGTHLRGDINCLMVGDPGVAKSQMLRAVMNVAHLAVSTTGRGSSGVGLTAAVTTDKETGEKRLEAGAMVLADRGIVCIDEFDKMNDIDRIAIHEVMEQQTVTIAKAGIQTSLNARCSVVAAANPLYGTYDHNMSVTRNVNLPDSLLSRFDLLFVVLDNLTQAHDRQIADHVLGQHRYRAPGDNGITVSSLLQDRDDVEMEEEEEDERDEEGDMYVKYDSRLYGPRVPGKPLPLSTHFLKKFLTVVKRRTSEMELTGDAIEAIGDFYAELRAGGQDAALPITVRTLETIIRLSTAAAKARLAPGVELEDVDVARSLMTAMLSGKLDDVPATTARQDAPPPGPVQDEQPATARQQRQTATPLATRGRKRGAQEEVEEEEEHSNDENDAAGANQAEGGRTRSARRTRRSGAAPLGDIEMADAQASDRLTEGQYNSVALVVREMLMARGATHSHTLDSLMANLRRKKLQLPEELVIEALKTMHERYEEDPEGEGKLAPIMYSADERIFYDAT
eukprot:jgi/Botrbrau1/15556/Bobra.0273s0008.1